MDRMSPSIVLASASPRRAALLRQLGVSFTQMACADDEPRPAGIGPSAHATEAARGKARGVRSLLQTRNPRPDQTIVIGADTLVCIDGEILGKPLDRSDAARMLTALSGNTHQVYTGICILSPYGTQMEDCSCTQVAFKPLSAADIESYVNSGEPMDKAGSYGIQGLGARFVERIEGCYYNVVGLPLSLLTNLMQSAGYDFTQSPHDQR